MCRQSRALNTGRAQPRWRQTRRGAAGGQPANVVCQGPCMCPVALDTRLGFRALRAPAVPDSTVPRALSQPERQIWLSGTGYSRYSWPMGILDRVSTLMRANINDMIDRAEDPEKVVKQLIIDMNNQLIQVKTLVAAAIADEKRLYQRQQEAQQQADEWQSKAELAVEKGDDDLAKQALARRNSYTQTAQGLQEQWQAQ